MVHISDSCVALTLTKRKSEKQVCICTIKSESYNLWGKIRSGIVAESSSGIGKGKGTKILLDPCLSQLHSKGLFSGICTAVGDKIMSETCPLT